MNHSRRDFLRLCLASGTAFYIPRRALGQHGGHTSTTPSLPAFVDPLPIPPVLKPKVIGSRDTYKMTMQEASVKCHRDLPFTNIIGYNGLFPGPTIKARKNRAVRITHTNLLPAMIGGHQMSLSHLPAVHLHGALVAPSSDGHPDDGIPRGQSRVYDYPNRQRGCGMWYHDHTHGATGHNVYMGLAGLYLLEDVSERALRLPRGPYEVPLVIMDRVFDATGQMTYALDEATLESGKYGDVVLINGKIQPFFNVAARKYRFRVLNASNAREYKLALSNGMPLIQIGTDGGLLQRPLPQDTITIAPSERVDFIVDFAAAALNSQFTLRNLMGEARTISLMQFNVNRNEKENAVIPNFLRPWVELPAPEVTRTFNLNRQLLNGKLTWVINGYAYESPERAAQIPKPKLNTVEHWRFVNPTLHPHPMHMHLVQFQVVNIDGEPQDSSRFGWKDTVVVPPGSEVTVAARFEGYTGKYVFHCHNLEHEDFAMMSEFEVTP